MDAQGRIARAAGAMSIATLISRVLGYVKDMILARYFGATGLSDTFFVAFRIPNLLRELFAEGSMASAFIPVLTQYQTRYGAEEARRLVRVTFTVILCGVGLVCLAGVIFTPAIIAAIAPGFLGAPGQFSLAVLLTRIMFPFLLFISLASLVMGALNARKVFFVPALAPAFLNVVIIAAVLFLVSRLEEPIVAVAVGVAAGGIVQFAFQLPAFFRSGYDLRIDADLRHPGLRRMGALVLPATMGMAVAQINIFVSTILASYLPGGSITYLYYAMRLIQFPVGIFGVAMGMAVLPALSEHAVRGDTERLREDFSFALRLLFFITVPAMAGLIALREPIVSTLFQRGVFDAAATAGTALALLCYALGIWAIVGVRVVTATFYSLQDTRTPVRVAVGAMLANIIMSLALMGPLQHAGLALANSIASTVNFVFLFYFLRQRIKRVDARRILRSFGKIIVASAAMGAAGWPLGSYAIWQSPDRLLEKALLLSGTIVLCLVVYLTISRLLRSDELEHLYAIIRKRRA